MDNIIEIVKDKVEDLVAQIKGDGDLLAKFKSAPVDTVKELLGKIDLDDEIIDKIVDGIKAKLGADKLGGLLDKAKDLLGLDGDDNN